jgi:hypothetical protein
MDESNLNLTQHFLERLEERRIKLDWVIQTLQHPLKTEADVKNPTLTVAYKPIAENDNRVLKVVYNENTTPWTVITVHFHRNITRKYRRGEL